MKAHTVGDLKSLASSTEVKGEDASAVRGPVRALGGIRNGAAVMDGRQLTHQV